MTSPAKLAANRANAARSTGPRTPDGKRRSSQNALSHGLTAERVLLPGEREDEYDSVRDAYYVMFEPANAMEETLVDEIVSHSWRIRRVAGIEGDVLRDELARTHGVDLDDLGRAVLLVDQDGFLTQRLPRHERHLARMREDAIALLFTLQARRPEEEAQAAAVGLMEEPAVDQVSTTDTWIAQNEPTDVGEPAAASAASPDVGDSAPPLLAPAVGEG